jgi:hypothetical protein
MLKLFLSIVLVGVLFFSETDAQNFFPLQIGNKFQYKIKWSGTWPGGSGGGTIWGKLEVAQDSIINGKVFYKFSRKGVHFFEGAGNEDLLLFSYDSTEQKLYVKIPDDDTIRIAADFNIPNGSTFYSYIQGLPLTYVSEGIFEDSIFAIQLQAFRMYYESSDHPRSFKFGDNFGIIHFYAMNVSSSHYTVYRDTLYSAIIDTFIYNPLSLEITSISPLTDRPIDAFPFVLQGSYSASVSQLVDSFYVNVLHTREDSVLRSWRLDFNYGQVNIPIYTSMLRVGDIIKIRAKVTDESIFYNFDYYPDSGYAIIHVLDPSVSVQTEEKTFKYALEQNYPNPFNPATAIKFEIAENQEVELKIYDVLGNDVETLVDEVKSAGKYLVEFNGSALPSGVYFYQLKAGPYLHTMKMVLAK